MTANNTGTQSIDSEEIASAKEVILTLVKASKMTRLYLPNSPTYGEFLHKYEYKMLGHLKEYGDLQLLVDKFTLSCKGETIYENNNLRDSLAYRLHADGIREITFEQPMEIKEVYNFLLIVNTEGEDQDEDIVTRLWESQLSHVTYQLMEEPLDVTNHDLGAFQAESKHQVKAFQRVYKEAIPAEPVCELDNVPRTILTLTDQENDYLYGLRDLEEQRDPMDDVIHIVSSILMTEKEPEVFHEFIDVLVQTTRTLLMTGEFRKTVQMVNLLRTIQWNNEISAQLREVVKAALGSLITDEIRNGLGQVIEKMDRKIKDPLTELIISLEEDAIGPFCWALRSCKNRKARHAIIDGLVKVGKKAPENFLPYLKAQEWYVVRNAVYILRLIGSPLTAETVGRLATHKDQSVRKEVLIYLKTIPNKTAKHYLLKFLKDENPTMRMNAIRALGKERYKKAQRPLLNLTRSSHFEKRDLAEKMAVFEALGKISPEETIPIFRKMILKRYWWRKAKMLKHVQYAVSGLKGAKTQAALSVLKEAEAVRKGQTRTLISRTIKFVTRGLDNSRSGAAWETAEREIAHE